MVTLKTMRSRAKYFSMDMLRRLKDKIDQAQATRARLHGKEKTAKPPSKQQELRHERRKLEDGDSK
jgi:hypothetical protein